MGHKAASLITGLQTTTEGLAEVRAHMSGQFWASIYMQGTRGAGRVPLATTGAAPTPTKSEVTSDVEGLYRVLMRAELWRRRVTCGGMLCRRKQQDAGSSL